MASRGVNKVILLGNVGQDPQMRAFPDGGQIATLSLATSEAWKDKNTGEPQERTEWHRVVFRGKLAEIVGQYVHKGSKLYVEGKLITRKWQGQDGADRYSTEVVVDGFSGQMQMLGGRGGAEDANQGQGMDKGAGTPPRAAQDATEAHHGGGPSAGNNGFSDDIPFAAYLRGSTA